MRTRSAVLILAAVLVSCSKEAPPPAPSGPPKIELIANGSGYKTDQYLVPGYVTILEFYADW